MDELYRIAREVTDEVLGKGAYAEANKGNRYPLVQEQVKASEKSKDDAAKADSISKT